MVCGLFADHISTSGSPMDRDFFLHLWTARGVRTSAVDCSRSVSGWGVSVRPIVGRRAGRQLRSSVQCVPWGGVVFGLFSWSALNHALGADLLAGAALLLSVVAVGRW